MPSAARSFPAIRTGARPAMAAIEKIVASEELTVLGWRDVPHDDSMIGQMARDAEPTFKQLFLAATGEPLPASRSTVAAFVARKRIEHEVGTYFASLSARTLVYKGMLITGQLTDFYPDLVDDRFESALALVHSRFSTNTFPSWPLAHPYRMIAHNGEINTVMGNENWMRAREALLASDASARPRPRVSDLHAGRVRHVPIRRVPRVAPSRRTFAAAFGAHDDPGGVGEPRVDAGRQARVLPVPRFAHGAVGRTRLHRVHRRHRDRRGARSQWPAPVALLGHGRRSRRHGERSRRARHRPGRGRAAGPVAARPDVPGRHVARTHHRRRRAQGGAGRRASVRGVAARGTRASRRSSAAPFPHAPARLGRAAATGVRLHDRRDQDPPDADGQGRLRADRIDGHRYADRGAVRPAAVAVRLLPATVRAGHEPAARRHSRGAGDVAVAERRTGRQLARSDPGVVPADRVAASDLVERRLGEAPVHQRGRRPGRLPAVRGRRSVSCVRRRRRTTTCPRQRARRREQRHPRRRQAHHPLRPPLERRDGADPVAPAGVSGAPPPHSREDAYGGRARARVRRRPRGASHGAAARLWRVGGQPVPRLRDDRRPHATRASCPACRRARPCATTSRPAARACSR